MFERQAVGRSAGKMVHRCIVFGCDNTLGDGVSAHEFPTEPALRNQWTRFVLRTRAKWKGPGKWSQICSKHFNPVDFENHMKYEMGVAKKLLLKRGAVPSIYPDGTVRKRLQRRDTEGYNRPRREQRPRGAFRKREVIRVSGVIIFIL